MPPTEKNPPFFFGVSRPTSLKRRQKRLGEKIHDQLTHTQNPDRMQKKFTSQKLDFSLKFQPQYSKLFCIIPHDIFEPSNYDFVVDVDNGNFPERKYTTKDPKKLVAYNKKR